MSEPKLVHLVDDDDSVRRSVAFMLKTSGLSVKSYASGNEFLRDARKLEHGCVLLDIRMPGMDGLEVQQEMQKIGVDFPVIIMTGHGDIPLSVRAMKAGAIDFIEKPFEKATLLGAIEEAFRLMERTDSGRDRAKSATIRLRALTPREREVLDGLSKGLPNKTIAYDLGISPRTVEIHRANLMSKLEVRSLSEALRLAFAAEENQGDPAEGI